jgi:acyl-CoA synthetase (AMP-forming)/AMP-acid ligase II
MHLVARDLAEAPRPRAGRHVRRLAPRVGVLAGLAPAAAVAVLMLAGALAGAIAMTVAMFAVFLAACRLVAADDADLDEERWLRQELGSLRPASWEDDDEDADPDLLIS